MIRVIFDSHPDLAIPGESHFIPPLLRDRATYERDAGFDVERLVAYLVTHDRFKVWRMPEPVLREALVREPIKDMPDAIRRAFAAHATRKGKSRYADKTPRYAVRMALIADAFPEAKFIHVIRDGRDVALSLLEVPWGVKGVGQGALYWKKRASTARRIGEMLGPERYIEYRHEDLLDDPEEVVRRICDFIELPYDPTMLRYYEGRKPSRASHMQHLVRPPTKGLRDWRQQMDREDLRFFELLAGNLLEELGYERATDDSSLEPVVEAELRRRARRLRRRGKTLERPADAPLGRGPRAVLRAVSARVKNNRHR